MTQTWQEIERGEEKKKKAERRRQEIAGRLHEKQTSRVDDAGVGRRSSSEVAAAADWDGAGRQGEIRGGRE